MRTITGTAPGWSAEQISPGRTALARHAVIIVARARRNAISDRARACDERLRKTGGSQRCECGSAASTIA